MYIYILYMYCMYIDRKGVHNIAKEIERKMNILELNTYLKI